MKFCYTSLYSKVATTAFIFRLGLPRNRYHHSKNAYLYGKGVFFSRLVLRRNRNNMTQKSAKKCGILEEDLENLFSFEGLNVMNGTNLRYSLDSYISPVRCAQYLLVKLLCGLLPCTIPQLNLFFCSCCCCFFFGGGLQVEKGRIPHSQTY